MNVSDINKNLLSGTIDTAGLFPHLEQLEEQKYIFEFDFGLDKLPEQAGLIIVRGARQYGKSTWLERELKKTIVDFGAGTAFYINGDELSDTDNLLEKIRELLPLYSIKSKIKRLFIDEITAIKNWEKAIKRLADAGELKNILVVTTGSKATDLRRGIERLPGRKGKLERTSYLFLPISYKEFNRVCGSHLQEETLISYLISGGSPLACSELASGRKLPEYLISITRDWINGECYASKRDRASLMSIMDVLFKFGANPVGQAKLARETGLANNTVADGYIELLRDILCIIPSMAWDHSKKQTIYRKPCKYHFINLLAAISWCKKNIRTIDDFNALTEPEQGIWFEWLVAQELWRRKSIESEQFCEQQNFWQSKEHELDFVLDNDIYVEVKRGNESPIDYSWFSKIFGGRSQLYIINKNNFKTEKIEGISFENFLMNGIS